MSKIINLFFLKYLAQQPIFIICKFIFYLDMLLAKLMLCSMLVLLRPMKLIQPKFNVVVAAVTNGLTCTLIHLHNVLLAAAQPVHASHIQTIGTSSTLVLFCNVPCALTSRRQFVSLGRRHRLGFNFEI